MICHDFKGGIGTASRVVAPERGGWTVGALVQANYGRRSWLRVDGVPVGREIGFDLVPGLRERAGGMRRRRARSSASSPPTHRSCPTSASGSPSGPGSAWPGSGGTGANSSGDLFLAFATGNRGLPLRRSRRRPPRRIDLRMVLDDAISPLFEAAIEATEEAIVNALVAAETTTGRDGVTAHALPHDRLVATMARYGRGPTGRAPR